MGAESSAAARSARRRPKRNRGLLRYQSGVRVGISAYVERATPVGELAMVVSGVLVTAARGVGTFTNISSGIHSNFTLL